MNAAYMWSVVVVLSNTTSFPFLLKNWNVMGKVPFSARHTKESSAPSSTSPFTGKRLTLLTGAVQARRIQNRCVCETFWVRTHGNHKLKSLSLETFFTMLNPTLAQALIVGSTRYDHA